MGIQRWDIFCRVIDNYGDIGVCWRLARQLANEHQFQVRLWVDELHALMQIWPEASLCEQQLVAGVEVCHWGESFARDILPADVVIEAFACNLPESYLKAMKGKAHPPHWFNLEYLSAEDWVEGCHGLASPHPQLGLKKIYFFPGFTPNTGGLLKEIGLIEHSESYFNNPLQLFDFDQKIGINVASDELVISLFGYENTAVASLLDGWASGSQKILCLVPPGKILPDINRYTDKSLEVGGCWTKGSLRLNVIPFLTQTEYDRLLWRCDINFVRGEDSFARAQWAGKPFVWHIYPQDDKVHLLKLDAFLNKFFANAADEMKTPVIQLWHQWNAGEPCSLSWSESLDQRETWRLHCRKWRDSLNSLGDLASNMVQFCQKTI